MLFLLCEIYSYVLVALFIHLSMLSQTDNDLKIHSETFLKTRFGLFALRDRKSSLVGGADLDILYSILVPLVQ